jgi:glucose/arabinose dehydrogenase
MTKQTRLPQAPRPYVLHRRLRRAALLVALALALAPATAHSATTLPANFRETTVISGLTNPTAVRFASDGRVFVAEKSGLIKVFSSLTDTNPTVFADLRTNVDDFWDRGLLGLALDPNFPTKPYVYVLYTYDAAIGGTAPTWNDGCPTPPGATTDGCVVSGRLSRLTAGGNVMTGPENVLINDWCQQFPGHSIGTLAFGPDGALYASAGDGANWNFTDYGQKGSPLNPCGDPPVGVGGTQTAPTAEGGALRAQDLRTSGDPAGLSGAIVRVDPATGAALPDNPLASSSDANARRVIAYGMRNPFRFTFRPGTDELWIGDVGWNTWEELNRVVGPTASVKNFGWPCYEGSAAQGGYQGLGLNICSNLYAQSGAATAPYYTYNHSAKVVAGETCPTGSSSITGTAFYGTGAYPTSYNGTLFFADYSRNCIWAMAKGANGLPDPNAITTFAAGSANPVNLEIGPGGDLFYVDLVGGTIRRIEYFSPTNNPPAAVAKATPTSGTAPLTVSFDGTSSSDPDAGDTISYAWDLDGDGVYNDSTAAQPTYTYTTTGAHIVRLKVTDVAGATATDAVTISVGSPPTATISAPASTLTWKVGATISFSGSATDPQDGQLPPAALSWTVILHHCFDPNTCHTHQLQTFNGVSSGSVSAPDHEYPSYLELALTATDSLGFKDTKSVRVDPQAVALSFASQPSGLQVVVGSGGAATPFNRTVIVGSANSVSAPSPQTLSGTSYAFSSWSDGGAQSHNIVAPAAPTTYTANFASGPGPPVVGTQTVYSNTDQNPAGVAEAFRTTASGSGTLSSLTVYVDSRSSATKLVAGVYADNGGRPDALLTQGTLSSPKAGWNTLPVAGAAVTAGRAYWISVLGPTSSGTLKFRAVRSGGGGAQTSAGTNLASLPQSWATGKSYSDGPLSAYGSTLGSTSPLLSVSPSSLAFSANQGGSNPAPTSLSVTNIGSGSLNYTVADDAAWLTESPTSGSAPGSVQVTASVAGLNAGTYTGHVTIEAGSAQGSPQVVNVTLTVAAPPPPPPPPPPAPTFLVGDQTIESGVDSNNLGMAEAFETTAAATGTVSSMSVYLDAGSTASRVVLGLYADGGAHPGALLTQGVVTAPTAGAWNAVTVPSASVTAGTRYWTAILGTGSGGLRFRDRSGGCRSETSAQGTLTALPATWTSGSLYTDCPLSAYGTG